jgi:NTP pyrophosphatase (non-canonical NTP hydrolase)
MLGRDPHGPECQVQESQALAPVPAFLEQVIAETSRARAMHKQYNSIHEGYAVLLEEVDEFWDEVRKRDENRSIEAIGKELVQVATVARRIHEELIQPKLNKEREATNATR